MKKFLFIISAASLFFLVSCKGKDAAGGMSDTAKKNLEAFHTVDNAFMTGDISQIDSVVSSDFVDHGEKGTGNRDSLKNMITTMKKSEKDTKSETVKELADDEYVMAWMHWTGTTDGSGGMPAGPYDMKDIEVVRFKDGKAVEHWSFMEPSEMMKMMAAPTATDTTKHM